MRAGYVDMFIKNLGIGNPTIFVYQFALDNSNEYTAVITQFFIVDKLEPCVNFNSQVAHIFYGCNFSLFTNFPIMFCKGKHHPCAYDDTTVFARGAS